LPLLATVGLSPAAGAAIVLFGMSLGGILNPSNWVLYVEVMGLEVDVVKRFALVLFAIVMLAGCALILVELLAGKLVRFDRRTVVTLAAFGGAVALGAFGLWSSASAPDATAAGPATWLVATRWIVSSGFVVLLGMMCVDLWRRARRWRHQQVVVRAWAYLIPVVPLLAIMLFDVPILAAFAIGIAYAVLATARPGSLPLLVRSLIEGGASVMPAVVLMFGIGILISAVLGPADWAATHPGVKWPVLAAIEPVLGGLVPSGPISYVLGFGLAAPLALYRGPLNVWGLGFGVASVLLSAGELPPAAVMAMLLSVGQIQGICDPTNTANVWIANHQGVDVQAILFRTLPFVWAAVFLGLAVAGAWYV
ncbi:MAG: citrate transporter, partial [Planctomycetes bacterium]|nr:citrate transporter [Planctomycetota bacterium]